MMTTHKTLEAAREAVKAMTGVQPACIIEIEHEQDGRCYIVARSTIAGIKDAMRKSGKGVPGLVEMIAEHNLLSEADNTAREAAYAEANKTCKCHRCNKTIETATATMRKGWYLGHRVMDPYCAPCAALAKVMGD